MLEHSRKRPASPSRKGLAASGDEIMQSQIDNGTARASSKVSLPGQAFETGRDGLVMSFTRILILPRIRLEGIEVDIAVHALNRMSELGRPSYVAADNIAASTDILCGLVERVTYHNAENGSSNRERRDKR